MHGGRSSGRLVCGCWTGRRWRAVVGQEGAGARLLDRKALARGCRTGRRWRAVVGQEGAGARLLDRKALARCRWTGRRWRAVVGQEGAGALSLDRKALARCRWTGRRWCAVVGQEGAWRAVVGQEGAGVSREALARRHSESRDLGRPKAPLRGVLADATKPPRGNGLHLTCERRAAPRRWLADPLFNGIWLS